MFVHSEKYFFVDFNIQFISFVSVDYAECQCPCILISLYGEES